VIVAFESVCWGDEHSTLNAALLSTLLWAYPEERLVFYAEPGHLAAVRPQLNDEIARRVEFRQLEIPPKRQQPPARIWSDWRLSTTILKQGELLGARLVLGCFVSGYGFAALRLRASLKEFPFRLAAIHHMTADMADSAFWRLLMRLGKVDRVRNIVLSEPARRLLAERVPEIAGSLAAIPLPYRFPAAAPQPWPEDVPVRFGFLGAPRRAKGFHHFCALARASASGSQTRVRAAFELVGRLSPDVEPPTDASAVRVHFSEPPTRSAYEDAVSRLSYVMLPYDQGVYGLQASGTMLDAFGFLKPCIVLRNPIFEDCFQHMGDIGYLCDSVEEMQSVVRSILEAPPIERYARQCANILEGRSMFEPPNVAPLLREALDSP
jgi:hypothetical protein